MDEFESFSAEAIDEISTTKKFGEKLSIMDVHTDIVIGKTNTGSFGSLASDNLLAREIFQESDA